MSAERRPAGVELRREGGGRAVLRLSGALDVNNSAAARRQAEAAVSAGSWTSLEVDASGVERADMSGMALLYELASGRIAPGAAVTVKGLRPEFQLLLDAIPDSQALASIEEKAGRPSIPMEVGTAALSIARDASEQVTFIGNVVLAFGAAARRPRTMRRRKSRGSSRRPASTRFPSSR